MSCIKEITLMVSLTYTFHPSLFIIFSEKVLYVLIVQVAKMKNKLGTRQLPTAELLLDGCKVLFSRNLINYNKILLFSRLN